MIKEKPVNVNFKSIHCLFGSTLQTNLICESAIKILSELPRGQVIGLAQQTGLYDYKARILSYLAL